MNRIAGWSVSSGVAGGGGQATAEKAGVTGKQHVVSGISMSYNGTPGTPAYAMLIEPDVTPNVIRWEGFVAQARDVDFPDGIAITPGASVALVMAGSGGLTPVCSIQGVTL